MVESEADDITPEEFEGLFATGEWVTIDNRAHGWATITDPGPFLVVRRGPCSFDLIRTMPTGGAQ